MEDESQIGDDVRFVTMFDAALQMAPIQRQSFLEAACAAEPALLAALTQQLAFEERMGDFLLEPLLRRPLVDHPFQSGDLAAGRFRIVREVARGGMGVIYEAIDERLGQRRALKCARPGFHERLPPKPWPP